ncbi:MAG: hypothetical protein GC182_02815 [Rhodopseudomonas sp.]|nr:hypothetical protein [Rhodopseudomonas sp.]
MRSSIGATVLAGVALAAGLVGPAAAQSNEPITGRWAADALACSALSADAERAPLVVTVTAMRWRDDACRIARMYKTGDTVHMQALCFDHAGQRSIPVALRPHGDRLAVTWDRARHADLQRCP